MNPVTKIIHVTSGPQFVEDLQTINDERKKKDTTTISFSKSQLSSDLSRY